MNPSHGLGRTSGSSSRNSTGHTDGLGGTSGLADYTGQPSLDMYANYRHSRPAPPPPVSPQLGRGGRRRASGAGLSSTGSSLLGGPSDPFARRPSLGLAPSMSGLSASRPLELTPEFTLPPLNSFNGSGSSRLGSGQLGGGLGLASPDLGSGLPPPSGRRRRSRGETYTSTDTGGLDSLPPVTSFPPLGGTDFGIGRGSSTSGLYSSSQPIDIGPSYIGQGDWRSRLESTELENLATRETRREARRRTRRDWEEDGELHPGVSLDSDLEDSTDGEDSDTQSFQPRQRRHSVRRMPSMENLRASFDDSGIGLGQGLGRGRPMDDLGLGALDLNAGPSTSTSRLGGTILPPLNGQRDRRGEFSSHELDPTLFPPLDTDYSGPLRRSSNLGPPGPPPTIPLPPIPDYSSGSNTRRRPARPDPSTIARPESALMPEYPDLFNPPMARVPGQYRNREHMVEFTDGDYTVRIRNNQRARQEERERERGRTGNSGLR